MSYQNWEYTNPGWNNNTPPPLSSSNLNDIASALEKLNISDEQIATIKSYLTDVIGYDQIQNGLGQLMSVLATARNQDKESIDNLNEQVSQKGNCNIGTLQYTGNGTDTVVISSLVTQPVTMFIKPKNAVEGIIIYQPATTTDAPAYLRPNGYGGLSATYSSNTLTISGSNVDSKLNQKGFVYVVVYFY